MLTECFQMINFKNYLKIKKAALKKAAKIVVI